ncbi:titin homolog [Osmia bicornis bicornis]|uniref:titin homolog n=1 Tax=Osmia bicornis bicornis TaxID=1437191 RepID=UPI001EAED1EB|nr:titin homolog [Osmia bicornis bicornis]
MATPQASSRLELLQARFQQKQLQEKEQKLLQLYDQQQQRAYQVVQRGSAGSNGSNHGSSISQHTVTKTTTTTSHTTSTSQRGKVRQMFDERRQTTVKGIDRSYPLEPLENKPRKQTNGNVAQKNGNLTVNRQSVTVNRVARADVNSNLNGGKPIVSYHEEITRESYGPSGRQPSDDDEFGNDENDINQYANGNQTHIEEVLDEDTIERNRMMAKLHLMEYDETLKHRVKNDLESEEFPEDYMVDVPDKLPKQSVTKKLSQAEARLERFKNANAKRSNSLTKNPSTVLKKRSDPIFPAKSTSSEDKGKTRIHRGSRNVEESVKSASRGNHMEDMSLSLDSKKNFKRRNENPKFFYQHTGTYLRDLKGDEELIDRTRRSESPRFFCKESEKSATTYAIDSKSREKLSPEFVKNVKRQSESPQSFNSKSTRKLTDQLLSKERIKRSESPKFFCKESERSATTYAIHSTSRSTSPDFVKREPRSEENIPIKSNFSIDTVDRKMKLDKSKDIDEAFSSKTYQKIKSEMDSKPTAKRMPNVFERLTRRSSSPKCLQTNLKNTKFSKSTNLTKKRSGRSTSSPQFFTSNSEKSATIMLVIPETIIKRKSDKPKQSFKNCKLDTSVIEPRRRMSEEIIDESSKHSIRSSVSRFFSDQCEKVSRNSEDGTRDIVRSAKGGWSPDSSPLSLKDMVETSQKCAEFSGKAISATSIDSIRDWSPKSRRNSKSLTPQFPKNKNHPNSTENTLLKQSKSSSSQKNIKKSKSKSPEIDRGTVNILRSTRLIRDAIKRQNNNNKNEKDEGSRRNCINAEGISIAGDFEKKVAAAESSPKSSTSVEVDAEIQEITMPDQYMKHQRGVVNSKSPDKTRRSSMEELFTYSVRKPGRKKTDRLGTFGKYTRRNEKNNPSPTNDFIFRGSKRQIKGDREIEAEIFRLGEEKILGKYSTRKHDNFEYTKKSLSNSPSPTSNSTICSSKNVTSKIITKEDNKVKNLNSGEQKKIRNKSNDLIIPVSKRKTIEKVVNRNKNERILHRKTPSPIQLKQKKSNSKSPEMTKESEILHSMELVRKVIKGESFDKEVINKTIDSNEKKSDSTRKSSSTIVYINDECSRKNYERTDSVESALKRFDSIGTESVQSSREKRQTLEEAKAISLKALNQIDANLPQSISVLSREIEKNESKTARARDSTEMARITMGSKTAACKRKLFQYDSGEETETGSSRSRYSLEKLDLKNEKILGKKNKSRDEEVSLSVKQLRSIEDIRKSIDSCFERKGTSTKSAIANDTLKLKRLPRRSENLAEKNDALGDAERSSIKCAIRFSRVTKSPSPDSTKTTETSSRPARRNVLSSPSKSPDTVARRPSIEMKGQEARSTKRPTLMKGTEPIGNRKTTTTTTSRRKSTDVVDGAILENGVHLRDQTAETKYDNDSAASKKSDAFVIDLGDEQPPKENDAPLPRKSLLRKQSTDKQIPSTQTGRSPSAMSSTCTGSSVQGQVSGSKGKIASKAKTPTSGATQKTSASSKCGGNGVVADSLVACKICGRRFAQDRVTLHEQICTKTAQKKRKQFDAMMYRVKGTDLEKFVRSGHCKKQPEKLKKPVPKSNWRRKHEDFINAIRSAKQVQAHLAAGGKLSDLPPPPASDTSDYVQCPHCGRKFNQSAAERHIPKCENMLHNKPVHSRAPKPKR